ncbi:MAG: MBL fold metallo-hydrolase [Candidatus Thorarchaeota archaeon]|jgi:glyoxylase-like metal-dependent hydrolase (beta-lactamase superfamily II)
MAFSKLADCVYVVIGGTFPKCNTIVIIADEVVVIDPGCAVEDLRGFLMSQGLELRNIDTIILSHIHPDHIIHTMRLNRLSGCRIAANEVTAPLFNEKEEMKKFLGFHKSNPVRKLWEQLVNERMYGALDEGKVDEVLKNGDTFNLGDITLRMLFTPGHLPDHMCIEILEPNLIFGSDIDLTEFGPYYGHPNSSIQDFKTSIRKVQHGKYDGLISGHLKQPLVEDYKDRLTAYSRQIGMREDLVLTAILEGVSTIPEINANPIIYPSLTNPVFLQFETWMIEHHVASLIDSGLIEEHRGKLRAI